MRCQYCGREAQPGQVYCECGHPISLSGGTDYGASGGFPDPPSDYDRNWYTPDGRSLSSLEKKSGMGAGGKILIMLIVLAIIGVGAFVGYKLIKGKDVLDEDSWEKRDLGGCTITIPSALEESDNVIELNQNYKKLGFFTSENAAVYVTQYQLSADEQSVLQAQGGVDTLKKNIIDTDKRRKINGQQLDPKQRGDLICVEYPATKKNYIKSTDDVWILNATLVTQKGVYELEACCPKADKDKYIDSMYKWLESFKAD
ncbi:MAG: hypothetical protein IJ172_11285 [Ruminococcus sp.]|nr:hypothetical protein [Ruminococcus sp.]